MMRKNNTKHIVLIGIILVGGLGALLLLKNRMGIKIFSSGATQQDDLLFINDSSEIISVEYKENGKNVSVAMKPNDRLMKGQGLLKIFVSGKGGSYDLSYSFPRPFGSTKQIMFSQVMKATQKEELTNTSANESVLTEKGMIGDVKVTYEEVVPTD